LITAETAAGLNLINEVVEQDALMDWALGKAESIAANSPSAVQAVKTQISATIAAHAQAREPLDQELGDKVRAGPDFTEGVSAFLEKRKPRY
jgi:enoyl-CoA hydratase/carnithine racemase